MSNKKQRESREVFLDFTMNDDNNLLEQIQEVEKSFALDIPNDANNKVKHTKVTMAKNEDKGKAVNNMRKSNLSIDLAGTNELKTPTLEDLVKETEGLIETISETVQETAKISSQKIEPDFETLADTMFTTKEDLPDTLDHQQDDDFGFSTSFDTFDDFPTIDQDLRDADPYTPHFINDELIKDTLTGSEAGLKTSPFMGDVLSAADLFDEEADEESDVLEQTGSFLFNTKDLHLFSQEDDSEDMIELVKQVDVEQTLPESDMSAINGISQKINDLEHKQKLEPEEVLAADTLSQSFKEVTMPTHVEDETTLPPLDGIASADAEDDHVFTDEPTVVAKLEDIDILLQKLDEISEKEMLDSLSQTTATKADAIKIPEVQTDTRDEAKTEPAPVNTAAEKAPDAKNLNGVRKEKPLIALTAETILSEPLQAAKDEISPTAPQAPKAAEDAVIVPGAAFTSQAADGGLGVTQHEQPLIGGQSVAQPATAEKVGQQDFTSTQEVDLTAIGAMTNNTVPLETVTPQMPIAEDAGALAPSPAATATESVSSVAHTMSAAPVASEPLSGIEALVAKVPQPEEAPVEISTATKEAMAATIAAIESKPEEIVTATGNDTLQAADLPVAPPVERSEFADITAAVEAVMQDDLHAEVSSQHVETTDDMLHTDELMNLHEEMKQAEAERLQALAEEEQIDLDMVNQETNPLDFPDVYFVNGSGSVSNSAFHATSAVNYATYLDATTQENNQLSALVNSELHFAEAEQHQPQQVDPEAAFKASIAKAQEERIVADIPQQSAPLSTSGVARDISAKPLPSTAVPTQQTATSTGRTKPRTFADMGTTLVNLSAVDSAEQPAKKMAPATPSFIRDVSEEDLFAEKKVFEIENEPRKTTADKGSNQVLMMVIIALVTVIIVLLGFIIWKTLV